MANPSLVPAPGDKHLRVAAPQPVPAGKTPAPISAPSATGPRKLVRPPLSEKMARGRLFSRHAAPPLTAHRAALESEPIRRESSHAEVFYFQKQVQTQTLMTFVLDDGESIEGFIEWYDQDVIKVRHRGRTMIYKSCIKYLYKSGENQNHKY